ncbi:MAG: hypothetical protein ABIR46_02115 [Candidatus Saccharimonadales bacterium]
MKKLLSLVLGAVMVPAVAFSTVSATGMGQLGEGNFYYSPQNGVAVDPATLACGSELTLKIRAHNGGPSTVQNTTITATLPNTVATSHVSKATISSPYADPSSTSDNMTVNLDKAGRLTYVAGSTELLNSAGTKLSSLPDTLTTTGVNIGEVKVSVQEIRSVQFKVKAVCETPEVPKDIQVCELATKKIITIKETDFDAAKHSKNLDDCKVVEVKKIQVCVLASKTIATINENEFDAAKHSKNLNDCKTVVTPGKIQVCELATKKVITISETDFDASKHDKDLNKCAVVAGVTTPTPTVIASTGPASTALTMLGLGSLAAAGTYYVRSRRNILG